MKRLGYLMGVLGLAVAIVLIARQGWSAVAGVIGRGGWPLLWLLLYHALPLLLDVFGWRTLLAPRDPGRRARVPVLFWIAAVREAVSRLLPVASIGGEIVGVRLLMWRGIDAAAGAASIVMEVVLTVASQYLFIGLGLVLMIALTAKTGALGSMLIAIAVTLPVPIGLLLLLRHGSVFARLEAIARRLFGGHARLPSELFDGARLDREIHALYARPARVAGACAWQLLGLVAGSFENWLALRLLGHSVGIVDAIALEVVTQALRHVFFLVPSSLGVQEGGLLFIGNLIGLPADVSIALSLVKRMREFAFGVPALISWQWTEARRLRRIWRGVAGCDAAGPGDAQSSAVIERGS